MEFKYSFKFHWRIKNYPGVLLQKTSLKTCIHKSTRIQKEARRFLFLCFLSKYLSCLISGGKKVSRLRKNIIWLCKSISLTGRQEDPGRVRARCFYEEKGRSNPHRNTMKNDLAALILMEILRDTNNLEPKRVMVEIISILLVASY